MDGVDVAPRSVVLLKERGVGGRGASINDVHIEVEGFGSKQMCVRLPG